ncbi:MAG: peptidyl-prolyl cis-trans isomerase [Vicinamibacterales bacterium]
MTMLDRMRRHKNWLKWSLAIVVVAFVLLYIPNFLRNGGMGGAVGVSTREVVASVDGREITVGQFRKIYNQQMQAYRRSYGGSIDERLLKQMGIDRRILQQLIDEEAGLSEARRLGLTTSDAEVRARILALPAFQENGQFIGDARYRQLLQMADPPRRPSEFEEEVRRSMTLSKLQGALTDWMTVSAADVTAEYKKRNEKVKLAVISFPSDKFLAETTATDADLAQQFEQHKADYRIPDKRKVRYALLDTQSIRARTQVTPQDVQRYYEDNEAQYATPEETRASHILLKTEGKDDAAVKKQAEDLLAQIKSGGDFAALAAKFSEDDSNKDKGGDLGLFPKGQMVPEFDTVAFSLQPGQISDVVKTSFGYHIIKVVERKPATKRTLDEVRAQIEDQLKSQRAQDEAQRTVTELAPKITKPADLDAVAKPRGFTVAETDFFSRTDPVMGLGMSPAVAARAFELKDNEVSDAIQTPQGVAFITVTGKQAASDPSLDAVKDKVRLDVVKKKAVETARQKAAAIAGQLKTGDFTAAAKAAGLEVKTTELIARGAPIGDAGVSPAIEAAAFALPAGGVSDPIVTENGAVVVKVLEHPAIDEAEMAKGLDPVRADLLGERRNQFFSAYMTKARERMQINVNQQTIAQILA